MSNMSFEYMREILTSLADDLPQEIYHGLGGGIILLPEIKMHPENINNDFYILGQYRYEPNGFGRYIVIYYGSFCNVHGHLSEADQTEKLKAILHHELVHHLEHLAGDRSLEYKDADGIMKYKQRHSRGNQ